MISRVRRKGSRRQVFFPFPCRWRLLVAMCEALLEPIAWRDKHEIQIKRRRQCTPQFLDFCTIQVADKVGQP